MHVACVRTGGEWIFEGVDQMNLSAELCGQNSRGGECSLTWRAEISRNENASETPSNGVIAV